LNCWHCGTELIWGGDHDLEDVRRNVQEQKSLSSGRTPSYYGGFKKEVFKTTKTYTIAPAYNNGAYQVISREEVKNIGK